MVRIGVLGGIGPEATGMFYNKLISRLQEKGLIKSNFDFPQIIINSIPAPELVFEKINESDLDIYIEGLKELDSLNLDFIVMVCNTIHLYYDVLQKEINTPILDLRKEVFKDLKKEDLRKVTIIATPSTIKLGLYEFEGIDYLNPDEAEMKVLSDAIFRFNKGEDKNYQRERAFKIVNKYLEKGAEVVLLGCTEFAVMLEDCNIPKKDSIDVLVEGVVKRIERFKTT